jgi:hypothetical protein
MRSRFPNVDQRFCRDVRAILGRIRLPRPADVHRWVGEAAFVDDLDPNAGWYGDHDDCDRSAGVAGTAVLYGVGDEFAGQQHCRVRVGATVAERVGNKLTRCAQVLGLAGNGQAGQQHGLTRHSGSMASPIWLGGEPAGGPP